MDDPLPNGYFFEIFQLVWSNYVPCIMKLLLFCHPKFLLVPCHDHLFTILANFWVKITVWKSPLCDYTCENRLNIKFPSSPPFKETAIFFKTQRFHLKRLKFKIGSTFSVRRWEIVKFWAAGGDKRYRPAAFYPPHNSNHWGPRTPRAVQNA